MKNQIFVVVLLAAALLCTQICLGAYHHEGEMDASRFLEVYPDKQGTKLDWFATWRNWVREERGGQMAKPRQPHTREDFAKIDYGTGIQDI